jgi:biopolymer transport protein ExbD
LTGAPVARGGGLDNGTDMVSDMTPLVDLMLVLLIIFIFITVLVFAPSVKLNPPRANNIPNLVKPDTVHLSVTVDGGIHWNEEVVTTAQLARLFMPFIPLLRCHPAMT